MGFNNWTVAKKLWLLSILTTIVLCSVQAFNMFTIRELSSRLLDIGLTQLPVVRSMTLADMMHDGLRAVVYRSLIASINQNGVELEEATQEYAEFSEAIEKDLQDIKKADVSENTKSQIDSALVQVKAYVQAGQEINDLAKANKSADALKLLPSYQVAFENLEKELEKLGEQIESQSEASVKESEAFAKKFQLLGSVVAVLGLVFTFLLSISVNTNLVRTLRGIVSRLEMQATGLKRYTEGVSSTSRSLSTASQQSASAVQETASAIEEINAMVAKTAENTQILAQSSQFNTESVQEGQTAVEQMLREIHTIKEANQVVMAQIDESNEQIKKIVRVVGEIGEKAKVINEIVFQTKLLSFNASVEAARAGENGKGFAVVAEEVGNLALMSGQAAKDITQMLESGIRQVNEIIGVNSDKISKSMQESTIKIESGKKVADQCGDVFSKIVGQTSKISQLTTETMRAIKEQQIGLNEINTAIRQFSESSESNASNAAQSSEIAGHLQKSFNELNTLMMELQATVNGNSQMTHYQTIPMNNSHQNFDSHQEAA